MKQQDNIQRLEGAERIRNRTESMLGSKGIDGARQTFVEIIGNSLDQLSKGYGDKIEVTYTEDNFVSVRDYGAGVPMGWNEEAQDWNWRLVYNELYASGKYNKDEDLLSKITTWDLSVVDKIKHIFRIGMNGVGASCSCYTAEDFEVISYYGGKAHRMTFHEGNPSMDSMEEYDSIEKQGTYVKWRPDKKVFTSTVLGEDWLYGFCNTLSYVAQADIVFTGPTLNTTFKSKTIQEKLKDEAKVKNVSYLERIYGEKTPINEDGKMQTIVSYIKMAMTSTNQTVTDRFFMNMVPVSGGQHSWGYESAILSFLKSVNFPYRVKSTDLIGVFSVIMSTYSNTTSMRGQTKDYVEDRQIGEAVLKTTLELLSTAYNNKERWVLSALEKIEKIVQYREASEAEVQKIKAIVETSKKKVPASKFAPSKNYMKNISDKGVLFLVEGGSAAGVATAGRDGETQSIYSLRGKGLNVWKSSLEKALENEELQNIMSIMDCGIEVDIPGQSLFDINKLKFEKIVFLSDADIDGRHIDMLNFTVFFKFYPTLLREGKVFVAKTPLYKCTIAGEEGFTYFYNTKDYEEAVKTGRVLSTKRFKGLGSMDANTLWESTLDPESGRYEPILIPEGDEVEVHRALEVLFGSDTKRRKSTTLSKILGEGGYSSLEQTLSLLDEEVSNGAVDNSHLTEKIVVG